MKLALEAPPGLVSKRPDLLVEALAAVAQSEGLSGEEFMTALAKAAGATRSHQHATDRPQYRVLREAGERAGHLYESAMTVAVNEIIGMIAAQLEHVDLSEISAGEFDG